MNVAHLIAFLATQPLDMEIVYDKYSERCLLELTDIEQVKGCKPRTDGWVQNERPDKEVQTYLCFPGN